MTIAIPMLVVIPLLLGSNSLAATDLDKPIEPTRPTIRTEIYRGVNAEGACGIDTDRLLDCIFAIQNKNVQQNTSTDALNAGLFFSAWLTSSIHEDAVRSVTGGEAKTDAERFFKKMKEYQTKLQIDNRSLCEAARVKCERTLQDMQRWESKYKTP
jgi:hypothetical protein